MKIIRSYTLREIILPFFLSLIVLTCVFLLGNLIQLTNLVINKGVSIGIICRLFLYYIPVLLGYTLPISCLISIILTFSRFSVDNEILALRASGLHLWKLLTPLIFIGIILSMVSFLLNDRIIPYAHHEQRKMLKNLGTSNPTALLEAGIFIQSFDDQIIFIHRLEGNLMYNISIWQPQEDGPTRTIIANRGEFTVVPEEKKIKFKLIDGTTDEPNLENPENFYKLNFDTYFMTLDLSEGEKEVIKKPKSMSLKEILVAIDQHIAVGMSPRKHQTEFWRKITWSFSPLAFILIGFPIAVITHRREKSANILLAIVCAGVYYLISMGCEALAYKTDLNPALIMWGPNIVALITATILNIRCVS